MSLVMNAGFPIKKLYPVVSGFIFDEKDSYNSGVFVPLYQGVRQQRAKEIGVRKTLGSSQVQLIGQFLSETLITTFIAGLLSYFTERDCFLGCGKTSFHQK